MKKALLFSVVLVLALASYGFVHFGETESERIDRLLEDNELVAAREAISDIKTTDSLFLKSVLFRLQVQDSAGDIFKALAVQVQVQVHVQVQVQVQ
ncbi:MAG: hypothetical protein ACKOA1_05295, partial [Bacteroidota bacterium]